MELHRPLVYQLEGIEALQGTKLQYHTLGWNGFKYYLVSTIHESLRKKYFANKHHINIYSCQYILVYLSNYHEKATCSYTKCKICMSAAGRYVVEVAPTGYQQDLSCFLHCWRGRAKHARQASRITNRQDVYRMKIESTKNGAYIRAYIKQYIQKRIYRRDRLVNTPNRAVWAGVQQKTPVPVINKIHQQTVKSDFSVPRGSSGYLRLLEHYLASE